MGFFVVWLHHLIEEHQLLEGTKRRKATGLEKLLHPTRSFPSALEEKTRNLYVYISVIASTRIMIPLFLALHNYSNPEPLAYFLSAPEISGN